LLEWVRSLRGFFAGIGGFRPSAPTNPLAREACVVRVILRIDPPDEEEGGKWQDEELPEVF
jgi:hypothetical protein